MRRGGSECDAAKRGAELEAVKSVSYLVLLVERDRKQELAWKGYKALLRHSFSPANVHIHHKSFTAGANLREAEGLYKILSAQTWCNTLQ